MSMFIERPLRKAENDLSALCKRLKLPWGQNHSLLMS